MPEVEPFTCRWSDSGVGAAWVHAAGGLDSATSSRLEATLLLAQIAARTVVLDLRGLTLVDSAAAHVIADAGARARQPGRRLMVVRGDPRVDSALELLDAEADLELFDLGAAGMAWAEA